MKIVVCIKQVPDTTEVRIDPRTNTMVREGVPSIVNPDDLHAVEAAVRLKERFGGRVGVITMGPPQAEKSLRRALSLGADEAVLISDKAFAAADTYATTYVLALAIRRLQAEWGGLDLVFCGKQALDGDTGQVGPGLGQRLGFPVLSYVTDIRQADPATGEIVVERRLGEWREVLASRLPALITVNRAINEVRYASLQDMIKAAEYRLITWSAADLQADPASVGLRGSPTKVIRSFTPPPRRGKVRLIPGGDTDPRQAAVALADLLFAHGAFEFCRQHRAAAGDGEVTTCPAM